MFWLFLVLAIAIAGYLLYRLDKKFKQKFGDNIQPADLGVLLSATVAPEIPADIPPPQTVIYRKTPSLFSNTEKVFARVLTNALKEYSVFAKVRVADVIHAEPGTTGAARSGPNNINSRYFDFVVCNSDDFSILCAVQLNEKSPQHDPAGQNQFLLDIAESAQLPIVQFDVQFAYSLSSVREKIFQSLGIAESVKVKNEDAFDLISKEMAVQQLTATGERPVIKLCPKCSAVMIKRKAKTGVHQGKMFWTCSTYPQCRGMVAVSE